MNLFLDI